MCEAVARVLLTTECVIEYSSDALSRATAVTNDMSGTRREERREERGEGVKRMREAPRPINHSHNSTVTTPVVLLSLSLCRSSGNIRRFFKRFLVYCIHYSRLSATLVNYERLHDKYKPKAKMQSVGIS
jgi:hypothetical protein